MSRGRSYKRDSRGRFASTGSSSSSKSAAPKRFGMTAQQRATVQSHPAHGQWIAAYKKQQSKAAATVSTTTRKPAPLVARRPKRAQANLNYSRAKKRAASAGGIPKLPPQNYDNHMRGFPSQRRYGAFS